MGISAATSCTSDSANEDNLILKVSAARTVETIANSNNEFDSAGKVYSELLDSYYAIGCQSQEINAVAELVDSIANTNVSFSELSGTSIDALETVELQQLLDYDITDLTSVINTTNLSNTAKTKLSNFLSGILDFSTDDDYYSIYNFIIEYEAETNSDASISKADKKALLTISSIVRYAAAHERKRPKKNHDPDWYLLVGSIIGTTSGINDGAQGAVLLTVAIGIIENERLK
ncbi:hypothetical protein ACFPVY_03385 [Flavobacterium qiangtangense]|uniref:Lipoprotein n=1 Tax=Flavobacterium qiangtangense TaxID=1442595 RepID=A0ABW1PJH4_9FLAO